jgi:ABC-2 type transport system permease protein
MRASRSFLIVLLASPVLVAFAIVGQLFIPAPQVSAAVTLELPLLAVIYSVTIAAMIAVDGFLGERNARTIEPLLAAPVSERDLFAGKVLAAFIPAIAIAYVTIVGMTSVLYLKFGSLAFQALPIQSLGQLFWETAVLALIATCTMTIVSARVNDTRVALQLGNYVMLGLVFGLGFLPAFLLPISTIPWLGLTIDGTLTVVGALLLWLGIRTFNRESMMSRV